MSRRLEKSRKSIHPNLEVRPGPTFPRGPRHSRQTLCQYEEFKSDMSNIQDRLLKRLPPDDRQRCRTRRNMEMADPHEPKRKRKPKEQMGQPGEDDRSRHLPSVRNCHPLSREQEDGNSRRYLSACRHRLAKKWEEQKQTMKELQKKKEEELKELQTLLRKERAIFRMSVLSASVSLSKEIKKDRNAPTLNRVNVSITAPSLELTRKPKVCRKSKKRATVKLPVLAGCEHNCPEAERKYGVRGSKVVLPPIKSKVSKQIWR
ncbi:uncharacterized protein [Haliotis cracherodii]|uniref:uncharacterized protein n=1 Tax=Haliotis cracherodii TaxID=6455 RepID=UPI0039E99206